MKSLFVTKTLLALVLCTSVITMTATEPVKQPVLEDVTKANSIENTSQVMVQILSGIKK